MQLLSVKVIVITMVLVTSYASSAHLDQKIMKSSEFEVKCPWLHGYNVGIICHSDDWTKFSDVKHDCPSADEIVFENCSFPGTMNVQNIIHSMKIKDYGKIVFESLDSIPNRQNLQGINAHQLYFLSSNFTELPFDLLYDVLNVDTLRISKTQLKIIPDFFFNDWAQHVLSVDIKSNQLQKIARNDFARLVNVITLNLSDNKIKEIEPGAFNSLVRLRTLTLMSNQLHTLPSTIFHQLGKLKTLVLNNNFFDELPKDLFRTTKNLREFSMSTNNGTLRTLPLGFFKNLIHLNTVILAHNQLQSLSSDLFTGCSALGDIILFQNHLRNLPSGLFEDTRNLISLNISGNRLESLPAGIFNGLDGLNELDVSSNRLTSLEPGVFEGLRSVVKFRASNNNLTRIDDQFIIYLKSATDIDLSHNQLNFEGRNKIKLQHQNASSSMSNLNRTLTSISENKNIEQFNLDPNVKLKRINLRYNNITEFNAELINVLQYSKSVDLRNNRISKINLSGFPIRTVLRKITEPGDKTISEYVKVYLQNNPLRCDCDLTDFVRHLNGYSDNQLYNIFDDGGVTCASPPQYENREIRDIRLEEFNCLWKSSAPDDACTEICICRKYPEKQVLAVDCSHRNLTRLPAMITNVHKWSIKLNMTGNMLQYAPSLNDSYLVNVTSLDLSDTNIRKVTLDLFSPKLQQLRLHGNSISRLDSNVIEYLAKNNTVSDITLHDNKWICDCETRQFLSFVHMKSTSYRFHDIRCYTTNQEFYQMTASELCEDTLMIIVIVSFSIAFLGIVVASLVTLYYKYQHEIKVWLYSKQWCLWLITEDELDKDKEYDAFISFSHKDEDFVEKEIVAKLEAGPRPYKLCLHYRDWLAGEWIPVQISRSVAESRRTTVILTPDFLESVWGLLEFRAAHTHALKEGRTRLIVILYGEIGNINDLDQEMKDYLRLNTYIKWGDPWFWNKLRYALPHTKNFAKSKTKSTDVIKNNSVQFPLTSSINRNAAGTPDVIRIPKYTTLTNDSLNPPATEDESLIASCL